ncbi:MAG: flagellar biosynthesis protein FlhF [Spirochaetaceae bacterium]|jgi:flagellar biosynthesis protein FlhF|nr:flagellar biosynthesis protein FlhF [Spirochaetaceae bacterium]
MEVFTVRARTHEECLRKIREIYGDRATVMKEAIVHKGTLFWSRDEIEITGYVPTPVPAYVQKTPPQLVKPLDTEEEKQKIIAAAAKTSNTDPKTLEILTKLNNLATKLDEQAKSTALNEHENLARVAQIMESNDFLAPYQRKIIERAKKELTLAEIEDFFELQQRVLEWIGQTISIFQDEEHHKLPRIIVLVGPTGVGKTTTVAKLAARFVKGLEGGKRQTISFITIDRYRVAAGQQLKGYADALGAPFISAEDADELKRELSLRREDADIILIDTTGKSPHDTVELAEMKQTLDVCGSRAEVHLAITAVTKAGDIIGITKQFEPFGYRSVIVTKLDETMSVGNVISALAERGKSVSYIADGQDPGAIKKAEVIRFLVNLEGFEVDRARLDKKFAPL